jgi:hypothetical protein
MQHNEKSGKGQWNEELASQSEAIVKAERSEIEINEPTIKKVQETRKSITYQEKKKESENQR